VVSIGEAHAVKEFVDIVLDKLNLTWRAIKIDPAYCRPNEVPALCGDSRKIRSLGWRPEYTLITLIEEMVDEACRNTQG
jgi:GDP-D-mannose dehydratase